MELSAKNKIGYFAHHALGDVIMKVPAIRWMCKKYGAENVYLTVQRNYLADLLHHEFGIPKKNMLIYKGLNAQWKDKLKFLLAWKKLPIDVLILPPTINAKLGTQLYKFSKAKRLLTAEKLIFFKGGPDKYFSKFKHKVFLNAEFIRLFEITSDEAFIENVQGNYYLDKKKYPLAANILAEKFGDNIQRYVIVHLGAGEGQRHKKIPLHQAIKIVEFILKEYSDVDIILTGSGNEAELTSALCSQVTDTRITDAANKFTLEEFIGVIGAASLFVSGDCGPVHVASILKVPIITFFGPTNFYVTGPFTNATVFSHAPLLNCMPCHDYSKRAMNHGCKPIYCLNEMNIAPALFEVKKILSV